MMAKQSKSGSKRAETRFERRLREERAIKYWLDRDDWLSGRTPLVSQPPTQATTKPVRKQRAPGAGRPRGSASLTAEQIKEGIRLLRRQERMKIEAACELLRRNDISASRTVLNEWIIKPAYHRA